MSEGHGPCCGCGELNFTAHNVSICAPCRYALKKLRNGESRDSVRRAISQHAPNQVLVELTYFEASMVLCVLGVAKSGQSQYDTNDAPIRKNALERAFAKLSAQLGLNDVD